MKNSRKPFLHNKDEQPITRPCDYVDCDKAGEFKAPKHRKHLREFYWFCLEHVREYNKSWDYYKDMSPDEIEKSRTDDITWERPTWPLGGKAGGKAGAHAGHRIDVNDPFGFGRFEKLERKTQDLNLSDDVRKALAVLGMQYPFSEPDLKKTYKALVKKHHPDLQHSEKGADEMIKKINHAYSVLGKFLKDGPG